ncbi:hypothetical protein [Roseateles sp.]|uniref:hypothetical protein n=1 Tax=Roseateles sp. TaxID=1971397 RepID=UPI003BAAA3FA
MLDVLPGRLVVLVKLFRALLEGPSCGQPLFGFSALGFALVDGVDALIRSLRISSPNRRALRER